MRYLLLLEFNLKYELGTKSSCTYISRVFMYVEPFNDCTYEKV